ncbi:hypothetical protein AgCh_029317 [Apium graveolens]
MRGEGNLDPVTWEKFKAALTNKFFSKNYEISRARRFKEGLKADIRHVVANFELSKYEDVLNNALVVERDLVDAMKKKNEKGKKKSEPASAFNDNGLRKFKNRGFDENANKGTRRNKIQCFRCSREH